MYQKLAPGIQAVVQHDFPNMVFVSADIPAQRKRFV